MNILSNTTNRSYLLRMLFALTPANALFKVAANGDP
jgi:hypothetical protein